MYEVLISDGTTTLHFSLYILWDLSSSGRAPALQAGGGGFKSRRFHQREVFLVLLGYIKLVIIFVKNQFRFGLITLFFPLIQRNENGNGAFPE